MKQTPLVWLIVMPDTFRIPIGTQVVLRSAQPVPNAVEPKPAGSVGVVADAPDTNDKPYTLRFVDGIELSVKFSELLIRKHDNSEVTRTPGPEIGEFVILRVVVGSRAFGLATDTSDEDRRGVYVPPAEWHWSLAKPPEQVEQFGPGCEEVVWEVEKYIRLALQGNPTMLEILWSPLVLHEDELGKQLREMRSAFLSKRLYQPYSGYVLSQFKLMQKTHDKTGTFKPKHAMHLLRLLHSGTHALHERDIRVDVGEHRDELLAVRRGERTFAEIVARTTQLNEEFESAYRQTALPDKPDFDRANAFLIAARRRACG